jgi:hypothetical protein
MHNRFMDRCCYAHADTAPPGWKPSQEVKAEELTCPTRRSSQQHSLQVQQQVLVATECAGLTRTLCRSSSNSRVQQAVCLLIIFPGTVHVGGAVMNSSSISGGATRQQPHGFWTSDAGPRPSYAADKAVSSTDQVNTRLTAVLHGVHVQMNLHLPLDKVPDLLALAGTSSSTSAQEHRFAPASKQEPDAGMGGELSGGSAWCNSSHKPADAAQSHQHAAAADRAVMAQLQQHLYLDPDEIKQQLSVYNSDLRNAEHVHLSRQHVQDRRDGAYQ